MTTTNTSKKIMMAAILTTGLTFAISQAALAQPGQHGDRGPKFQAHKPSSMQMTPEKQEIREKFLIDSKAERKALAQKNAEMRAIMKADAPDPLKASEVAGELFELREKLRLKALEAKLPLPVLMMGQDYHGMEYQDHGLMNPKK